MLCAIGVSLNELNGNDMLREVVIVHMHARTHTCSTLCMHAVFWGTATSQEASKEL